jgi:hypothetical protein
MTKTKMEDSTLIKAAFVMVHGTKNQGIVLRPVVPMTTILKVIRVSKKRLVSTLKTYTLQDGVVVHID